MNGVIDRYHDTLELSSASNTLPALLGMQKSSLVTDRIH
jgi:hypothetical protein